MNAYREPARRLVHATRWRVRRRGMRVTAHLRAFTYGTVALACAIVAAVLWGWR